jgi:hypothetical protein
MELLLMVLVSTMQVAEVLPPLLPSRHSCHKVSKKAAASRQPGQEVAEMWPRPLRAAPQRLRPRPSAATNRHTA